MSPHSPPPPAASEHERPIVHLNVGLTWRHFIIGLGGLASFFGSVAATGWFVLPAKQTDMTAVQNGLELVNRDLKTQQEITLKLIQAIERLDGTVSKIDQTVQKISLRPAAPKRSGSAR